MTQDELQNQCWHACYNTGDLNFVKQSIEQGLDFNVRAKVSGALPLDAAIYGDHKHIFDYLLSIGADPDGVGYEEGTMLMAAANQCAVEMLNDLLTAGANPNLASQLTGETPLHAVTSVGYSDKAYEVLQALLDAGADPNIKAKNGIPTPTYYRDITVVGETALHLAAAYGTQEMIELLICHGADLTLKDDRGDSPLTWFSRHRRTDKHVMLGRESRKLLLYGEFGT